MSNRKMFNSNYGKLYLQPIKHPQIKGTPELLRKMLEPVEHLQLEYASDSGSDITDPFAELNKDSIYSKKELIKHLGRNDINKLIVDGFTDEYKQAIKVTRQDMGLDDNELLGEKYEDIIKPLMTKRRMSQMQQCQLDNRETALGNTVDLKSRMNKQFPESEAGSIQDDYMKCIWSATEEWCKAEPLRVTNKGFHIYEKYDPYWLETPKVPEDKLEHSKKKCADWLLMHSQTEKKTKKADNKKAKPKMSFSQKH